VRQSGDPYAEKSQPWGLWILFILLLGAGAWLGWHRWRTGAWCWEVPAACAAPVAPAAPGPDAAH
jgi:hypothetical protein